MFRLARIPGLDRRAAGTVEDRADPSLLLITRDAELNRRVAEIAASWNWSVRLQPEPTRQAAPAGDSGTHQIVIFDRDSTDRDWREALAILKQEYRDACLLLASRVSDSYLVREVVRLGGYDVLATSGDDDRLRRALRFAWFWKRNFRRRDGFA
ncbi:MAG TPA: hypothetical protein VHB50_23685 [Bryobacteraceae bacterium]|nr:hypothetical protein [Bryobacteraceae bacterium]